MEVEPWHNHKKKERILLEMDKKLGFESANVPFYTPEEQVHSSLRQDEKAGLRNMRQLTTVIRKNSVNGC